MLACHCLHLTLHPPTSATPQVLPDDITTSRLSTPFLFFPHPEAQLTAPLLPSFQQGPATATATAAATTQLVRDIVIEEFSTRKSVTFRTRAVGKDEA